MIKLCHARRGFVLVRCLFAALIAQPLPIAQAAPGRDLNNLLSIEEQWHRDNTWNGAARLRLQAKFYPTIRAVNSVAADLDDGPYKWISYFKGGVVGYDKANRRYFMVYDPADPYEWIIEMRVIDPWVYMKAVNTKPDWSVRFNKLTFVLERGSFESLVNLNRTSQPMLSSPAVPNGSGTVFPPTKLPSGSATDVNERPESEKTKVPDPFVLLDAYARLDQVRFQTQVRGGQPSDDLIASEVRLELQIRPLLLERAIQALRRSFLFKSVGLNELSDWDFDLAQSDVPRDCHRCFRFHYLPNGLACDVVVRFGVEPVQDNAQLATAQAHICFQPKSSSQ